MRKFLFPLTSLMLGLLVLTGCTTGAQLTTQQSSCMDLRPQRPSKDGLTVGQLSVFSQQQAAAFMDCNRRLEEVARLYEDK
jgi:hypothetical protein